MLVFSDEKSGVTKNQEQFISTEFECESSILSVKEIRSGITGIRRIKERPRRKMMCIPLMSDNIYERGDAWRIWSCIYLAYLLSNTMDLLPKHDIKFPARWESPSFDNYKYSGGLAQRGKYLTRRKDKFWWRTLRKAYGAPNDTAISHE